MKIIIQTQTGESFINKIFKYVEDENLKTWLVRNDRDGNKYLTHKPEQWYDLALIGFTIKQNQLEVNLNWWKDKEPTEDVKGYYFGRFIEILLVHFKNDFNDFTVNK